MTRDPEFYAKPKSERWALRVACSGMGMILTGSSATVALAALPWGTAFAALVRDAGIALVCAGAIAAGLLSLRHRGWRFLSALMFTGGLVLCGVFTHMAAKAAVAYEGLRESLGPPPQAVRERLLALTRSPEGSPKDRAKLGELYAKRYCQMLWIARDDQAATFTVLRSGLSC